MVLEKTLESPLDCKEIQPVNPKGDSFRLMIKHIIYFYNIYALSKYLLWILFNFNLI